MIPIGYIRSPYKEKFAVPRQPRLASAIISEIIFQPPYDDLAFFREIEQYSHLWLIFGFNLITDDGKHRPLIRPPRLGGNTKIGVFASRSPYRPNHLGLSAVEFKELRRSGGQTILAVAGADLVDGSPIYDIKPYIAFTDSIPEASSGMASLPPERLTVSFTLPVRQIIQELDQLRYPHLEQLLMDILSYDHRPAYRSRRAEEDLREYGVRLYDFNVRFKYDSDGVLVVGLDQIS